MSSPTPRKTILGIDRRILTLYAILGLGPGLYSDLRRLFDGGGWQEGMPIWFQIGMDLFSSVMITLVISISVTRAVMWLQTVLPWQGNFWKRILVELVIVMLIGIGWTLIYVPLLHKHAFPELSLDQALFRSMTTTAIMGLILVSIYEGIFLFGEWKKSLLRTEQLEKESILSRYESLKHQVNPHFLFNSLNVLSGLVQSDPKKAVAFIEDFSSIYRYVLEHKDDNMVPLRDELAFIESFLHLLKIRFEEGLEVNIKIDPALLDHHVPPLSLQLLVENALKHNTVSKKRPLALNIYTREETLLVENTLQPRTEKVVSTALGLENLKARYEFFPHYRPEFRREANSYIAQLPLIP